MKYCVIVLAFVGVYGRIEDLDISNILVDEVSNIVSKIGVKVAINDGHANATDTKKTCLDIDNNLDAESKPCRHENKVDNGTALLLTPFIEEGRLKEARNASKVDPGIFLGIESYSGFLTVDKVQKSHLFFWYFPALRPANDTPWLIWLQGGPGASSLTGLFDEIGPFRVQKTLKRNPFTWLTTHSLIFIDSPVGSGYSFTESADGYAKDMPTYAKHLHIATKQLLQIFPELRVAPLYIAGESYAGKYVPALAMEIHTHKHAPGGDINLKGLIVGNGYVEPEMLTHVVRPFFHFGLLEKEQIEIVQPLIDRFQNAIANNRSVEAKEIWNHLVSAFLVSSCQRHAYNFLRDDVGYGSYYNFLSRTEVKRALHVGDIEFSVINMTVNQELAPEFLTSARSMYEELLEHYRVLTYCGQLDQMLPCASLSESYRKWKWSGSNAFNNSTRHPYILNRRLAGYHKSGGGLTSAVIRGAGHMVPMDVPVPIFQLVSLWTRAEPLPGRGASLAMLAAKIGNAAPKDNNTTTDVKKRETIIYL